MWTGVSDIDRMFGVMDLLRSRMNGLFRDYDSSYGEDYGWQLTAGTPRINLYDTGSQLELKAEVPGMAKNDLSIKIQGNYLELRGNGKSDAPEGYQTHRLEREPASFSRSLTLPNDVDAEKVTASLDNGILSLTLPKIEAARPKQVLIK